jgi:hypothetical protein
VKIGGKVEAVEFPIAASSGSLSESRAEESSEELDTFHVADVCRNYAAELTEHPRPYWFVKVATRICGQAFLRRISNLFSRWFKLKEFLPAERAYPVLPPDARLMTSKGEPLLSDGVQVTASSLAEKFVPRLHTIHSSRASDARLAPNKIRFEVLPPKEGKEQYSIIYYVRTERLGVPVPLVSTLYQWIKPIFFGSSRDWHAVQVDVNRDSGALDSLSFETCNYTHDPGSYNIYNPSDLQLRARVYRGARGWTQEVEQQNGRISNQPCADPASGSDGHPALTYISWNGGFDLLSTTSRLNLTCSALPKPDLAPLRAKHFRKDGFDLRTPWLERRKAGNGVKQFPPRKSHMEPVQLAL